MRSSRLMVAGEPEPAADFNLIGQEPPPPPKEAKSDAAAHKMIVLALTELSKRTLVALSNLFSLLLAGSAFALWWRVLPAPSSAQLIGLAGYAVFLLALDFVRRR